MAGSLETVTVPPAEQAATSTKAVSTNLDKFGKCSRCFSGLLNHVFAQKSAKWQIFHFVL